MQLVRTSLLSCYLWTSGPRRRFPIPPCAFSTPCELWDSVSGEDGGDTEVASERSVTPPKHRHNFLLRSERRIALARALIVKPRVNAEPLPMSCIDQATSYLSLTRR